MVNCVVFVLECVYMLFLGDTKCLGMKCHGVCMYSLFKCFSKKVGVYICVIAQIWQNINNESKQ